jgi:GNAT superfamily N-acetyltransferase
MMNSTHTFSLARVVPRHRGEAIALLQRRIERAYWPRLGAFMIACVTALFGVVVSAMLWRLGLEAMTWRYPLAVSLSYLVLLGLLYCWSRRDWWDWSDPNAFPGSSGSSGSGNGHCATSPTEPFTSGGGEFGGSGASGSFGDASDTSSAVGDALGTGVEIAASADEAAVIVVPLLLIAGLLALFGGFAFGLISLVWTAPQLLAQLMIDAGTAGLLGVYVRAAYRNRWSATALGKTLPAFAGLALLFMLAGYALEWADPTAITVFDVWANR